VLTARNEESLLIQSDQHSLSMATASRPSRALLPRRRRCGCSRNDQLHGAAMLRRPRHRRPGAMREWGIPTCSMNTVACRGAPLHAATHDDVGAACTAELYIVEHPRGADLT